MIRIYHSKAAEGMTKRALALDLEFYPFRSGEVTLTLAAISRDTEHGKQMREVVSIESVQDRHDDGLKFIESCFGRLSLELLQVELHIAKQMTMNKYFQESEAAYKRALAIQVALFGDHAQASRQSMLDLRQTLLQLNRHDEADALLKRASEVNSPTDLSQDSSTSITLSWDGESLSSRGSSFERL